MNLTLTRLFNIQHIIPSSISKFRLGQRGEILLLVVRMNFLSNIFSSFEVPSIVSGYRGAAARADQLLDTMESKYLAGDIGLKPNTFTYNAVSFIPAIYACPLYLTFAHNFFFSLQLFHR